MFARNLICTTCLRNSNIGINYAHKYMYMALCRGLVKYLICVWSSFRFRNILCRMHVKEICCHKKSCLLSKVKCKQCIYIFIMLICINARKKSSLVQGASCFRIYNYNLLKRKYFQVYFLLSSAVLIVKSKKMLFQRYFKKLSYEELAL